MLSACLQALPERVCDSSNASGTLEDKSATACPKVDGDLPPSASVVDGYPLIGSLHLSPSETYKTFETVKNLGKRSASHKLLSNHLPKQMKMDVEENCSAKEHDSLMTVKNKELGKNPLSLPELAVGDPSVSSTEKHGAGKINQQEEKIRMLEDRISQLTALILGIAGTVDSNEQKAWQTHEMIAERFQHESSALEEPVRNITLLQSQTETLETKTANLQADLDLAYIKIGAQGRATQRILGSGNHILEEENGGIN